MKKNFLFLTVLITVKLMAQPGKDGAMTVVSNGQVVNRYCPLSASLSAGSSTLSVAGGTFINVCPGDLIMVYQAQGATINPTNTALYGDITAYNSAGLYEFKYVQTVNGNIITTQSTFTNSYALNGRPQVIKVPQFSTLTINPGTSIVPKDWKDTTIAGVPYRFGGLVVIHAASIVNNGTISASGSGFRGGAVFNDPGVSMGATVYVSPSNIIGGEKGESIAGYQTDYDNIGGRYARGAPANGGGGGDNHNAAGGGGGNGFNGNAWSGQGVMIVDANNPLAAWALDPGYIANANAVTNSSGGGRGGYNYGSANGNALTQGPNNPGAWSGDGRREVGGLGGRPLNNINADARIYFGGGGGAPHSNNAASGPGSNGGGIVYLVATTDITGTGTISSSGNTAVSTTGCNCDAAPGAGAGGSIIIKTGSMALSQIAIANGGMAGSQLTIQVESEGPGGGGSGGFIALPSSAAPPSVNGGLNGVSLSTAVTEMISNGSTQGASGQTVTVPSNFIPYVPINLFTVSNNGPMCEGGTLNFFTNGAGPLYSWTGPNGFTSAVQNPSIANVSTAASGVYLLVLSGSGCSTATTNVTINPKPTFTLVNVTGSFSITCKTPSVDLAVVSNYTLGPLNYVWSSNSFTANGDTITVVSSSTLISVLVTDPATGCSATATTAIQLNIVAPTITLSPVTQSIGCGAGVVGTTTGTAINPTTNVTHNWYSPGISVPQSNGGPVSIFNPSGGGGPTPNATTTYTYIVTNDINGCASTKTFEVISIGGVYPTFNVTCSQNFSIGCTTTSLTTINIVNPQAGGGGQTTFTLLPPNYTGGLGYSTGPSVTYTVNAPGNYTMIVRDPITQCETRLTVPILQDIFPPNISSAALTRTLSCYTPTVVLKGISINTPSVPITYEWSFTNGANPNVVNSFSVPVSINLVTALTSSVINTYSLKITDQNNACINNTVVTMWQNIRPPVARISPSISAISCLNGSVTMANQSTTGIVPGTFFISKPIIGLRWDGPSPQLPRDSSSSYSAFVPGTYSMTALDKNNGCTSKTTATVTDEKDYPVLVTTNSLVPLDCGASTSGVKLPVTIVGNPPPAAYSATWYPPIPTPSVTGLNTLTLTTNGTGLYQLVVKTNSNSCISSIALIIENGVLTADFTADQLSGYAPLTVNFTNNSHSSSQTTGTQSITSVWSYGNGATKTTTSNIGTSAVYTAPGTYSVTMFATKGSCLDTAQQIIVVDIPSKLEVPNVFTPNGDGSNDIFFVKSANLTSITAQIFDRWGNKIYELSTDKGNIAWDGKNQQGKEVADGTYFYTIKAVGRDGQNYDTKGTVSLYR